MKLKLIIGHGCAGGDCPTVYETDRGTYVVQGYQLPALEPGQLKLGSNETAVEVPESLIRNLVGHLKK